MEIVQEQVGDLVLLGQVLQQSGLIEILDDHYPVHGDWRGPSVGQLTVGWLLYIISECDHRVSHVETWAGNHLRVLRWALSYPDLVPSHFQDDRLDRLLEYFSESSNGNRPRAGLLNTCFAFTNSTRRLRVWIASM